MWHNSEELYRLVIDSIEDYEIFILDTQGHVVSWNSAAERINGYKAEEIVGQHLSHFYLPEAVEQGKPNYELQAATREGRFEDEGWRVRKDGSRFWANVIITALYDAQGQLRGFSRVTRDLTARKQAEDVIKASLSEKEVLLKEIHHRVKNNLQVISSLLDLQTDMVKDLSSLQVFQDSQHRIRSMALIHEKLYQSPDLARVNFADYVQSLSAYLFGSYRVSETLITLRTHIEPLALRMETAIPCGLILNELMTNALKHAFPAGQRGEIRVTLSSAETGQGTLQVSDNGVGFPLGLDFRQTRSLGLQLVTTLTEQLEGTIELQNMGGATFRLSFPTA